MTPSKPFLSALALVAVAAIVILAATPHAAPVAAQEGIPLSTRLTPEMIDFFGLEVAYERPSIAALVSCEASPACGATDSSTVRFLDASGRVVPDYDAQPSTIIEQVRRVRTSVSDSVSEQRTLLRRFSTDEQGRIVMQGRDSIVRTTRAAAGMPASLLTRVRRYSDVRYLVNDPRFLWPLTGLVVLELSQAIGPTALVPSPVASHAAVSFDGTAAARVLTTGALMHRADLQAKRLETTMPER
ncbi:MAG: hypothetical protein U5K74_11630 [Gemmatimonadaceae bacterium]|nr:hypothetical protein [Gemmatimonadaceae bacterium]